MADVTAGGAAPQLPDMRQNLPRPVYESREAGDGRAEQAPDRSRQDERRGRRARNDMERHPGRRQHQTGDESDGDCADQAPVEEPDEGVPDRNGAGAEPGLRARGPGSSLPASPGSRPGTGRGGERGATGDGRRGHCAGLAQSSLQEADSPGARWTEGEPVCDHAAPRRKAGFRQAQACVAFTPIGTPQINERDLLSDQHRIRARGAVDAAGGACRRGNCQAVSGQRPWARGERAD